MSQIKHFLLVPVLFAGLVQAAQTPKFANVTLGKPVPTNPQHLFIPAGFDDNDESTVVVEGYLPDACHRILPAETVKDEATRTITVVQKALKLDGDCMTMLVPYTNVVKLGVLAAGDYKVATANGALAGTLTISAAKNTDGPDDFTYLAVDSARVEQKSPGHFSALLSGRTTNHCLKVDKVNVVNSGAVIEVLPIAKWTAGGRPAHCLKHETSFTTAVELPVMKDYDRHLVHVRSLNGQSVNVVFTASSAP